jgi:single-stranded-DNA-specific exonuclease
MDERGAEVGAFRAAAEEAARVLRGAASVAVVAHIDADGVSAGSIAGKALDRAGIRHAVRFIKKLDENEVKLIDADPADAVWLVDLGSSMISKFSHRNVVVADHHIPEADGGKERRGGNDLFSYGTDAVHVNPHLFGIDGAIEVSGAGVTYTIARGMDPRNTDLAPLAVVGAVGDLQDSASCHLVGYNRRILEEGATAGLVRAVKDLRIFGRETRPVARMLQFSTDPMLPGLTNDGEGCTRFLGRLGVPLTEGDKWRAWVDLTEEERRTVASALANLLLDAGSGARAVRRLVGEVYLLERETLGTELHDAKEYSTLLNACGRYGKAEIGLRICQGDRDEALAQGIRLQQNHRGNLADAITMVKDLGVERRGSLQYFHGRDVILDSIVGIVAGMVLGSGEVPSDVPIIAFAYAEDETVKVSARGTRELVRGGLDLARAIKLAAESVGGAGGGHNIAAGASIAMGREEDFLASIEPVIAAQLGRTSG